MQRQDLNLNGRAIYDDLYSLASKYMGDSLKMTLDELKRCFNPELAKDPMFEALIPTIHEKILEKNEDDVFWSFKPTRIEAPSAPPANNTIFHFTMEPKPIFRPIMADSSWSTSINPPPSILDLPFGESTSFPDCRFCMKSLDSFNSGGYCQRCAIMMRSNPIKRATCRHGLDYCSSKECNSER